jgi:predicted nucleic acid-binding protein
MGAAVSDPPRVYLDANVFVTAMENPGANSDHAWWIMHAADDGKILAVTSEITLAEVLVKPIEIGDRKLTAMYEEMILSSERFEVVPVRRDILIGAARLRARRNSIRLPDAIHIATALACSCCCVVSNDQRLHSLNGVKAYGITPFTLDNILAEPR